MPELPEVESIRKNLEAVIKGDVIIDCKVYYRNIVSANMDFERQVIGQKINKIDRMAKYLIFHLDDIILISHLRMEGKYFIDEPLNKHTHVEFTLKSGHTLTYQDTRKFGRFEIAPIEMKDTYLYITKGLAKDPKDINFNDFYSSISKSSLTIKELLLDQKVIGGVGNIYANEILYLSKTHPAKKGFLIDQEEAKIILKNTIEVITHATLLGGSTIDTFESLGHKGEFQQHLNVHGKNGYNCKNCGNLIVKKQLKGRGTYFCPHCQKSFIIALTGGIASGKSTVKSYLVKKGFKVFDSDLFVSNLYKDQNFINIIGKEFNVLSNNVLDKNKLANNVFSNVKTRKKLESIIHPLVFKAIEDFKENNFEHILFLDIPLLFETGYKGYDLSLLVNTKKEIQIQRLIKRNNLSHEEALLRIKSQISLKNKLKQADLVVDNNYSINDLKNEIDKLLISSKEWK